MFAVSDAPGHLFWAFWKRAQAVALRTDEAIFTYEELDRRAAGLAATVAPYGGSGERLAVMARPSVDLVVAVLGAYRAGWIAVPINPRSRAAEIEHILQDSGARVLVHDRHPDLPIVHAPALERRIETGSALVQAAPPRGPGGLPLTGKHGALLIYTSGTTGRSKGVLLTHGAVVDNMRALTGLWRWSPKDVVSLTLPLFHVHGLCIGLHGALLHGAEILLHERFEPAAVVADFRERGASVFLGVPTMYTRMLEYLEQHPDAAQALARGRLFTAGSAALPAADLAAFEACTGHRILERYGMSETLITLSNPHDGERKPGSVGRPVPGCEVRIVDEHGAEVTDEPGEILVRSNGIMSGYWNQPQETQQAFAGDFFRTGDIAIRDVDGYVRIVGRKSVDIIKSGGFKISAREIEDVLRAHELVCDAAVVGVPDPTWGERVVAAVVPNEMPGPPGFELALIGHVAAHLAHYKKPKEVRLIPELPRNALGKVQKHRLRPLFV